jgi:hypothetical protein
VAFRFEAEVISILESSPTDIELPWTISVGDAIHGQFTFEPAPIGQVGTQELGIQFEIGDVTLFSPTYEIIIALNQFPPLGSPTFEPFDTISVGCSLVGGPECSPKTLPGSDSIEWRPFMQLSGESPILDSIELIGDPTIWNMLDHRSLQLSFAMQPVGLLRIDAVVGPMIIVPEPRTFVIGFFAIALVFIAFARLGHKRSKQLG